MKTARRSRTNRHLPRYWKACLLTGLALGGTTARLHATINAALNAPVVNVSSELTPSFPASAAVDGFHVTTPQVGVTVDEFFFAQGYWLNNTTGSEYFIVDLGALNSGRQINISQIRIANTENDSTNHDRYGKTFDVLGANALDNANNLVSPVTLLANQSLTVTTNTATIPFDVFNPGGPSFGMFRYIEYHQLTAGGFGGGLNELQVLGDVVPEPSTILLLAIGGGLLLRRRAARK